MGDALSPQSDTDSGAFAAPTQHTPLPQDSIGHEPTPSSSVDNRLDGDPSLLPTSVHGDAVSYSTPSDLTSATSSPTPTSNPNNFISSLSISPYASQTNSGIDPTSTFSGDAQQASCGGHTCLSTGAIIAAVVIPSAVVAIAAFFACLMCRRHRSRSTRHSRFHGEKPPTRGPPPNPVLSAPIPNVPNPVASHPAFDTHLSPLLVSPPVVVTTHNNAYFSGLDTASVDDDIDRPSLDAESLSDPPPPYSQLQQANSTTTRTTLPSWSRPSSQTQQIRDSLLGNGHRARSQHSASTSAPAERSIVADESVSSRSSSDDDHIVSPVASDIHLIHHEANRNPFADPPSPIEP